MSSVARQECKNVFGSEKSCKAPRDVHIRVAGTRNDDDGGHEGRRDQLSRFGLCFGVGRGCEEILLLAFTFMHSLKR